MPSTWFKTVDFFCFIKYYLACPPFSVLCRHSLKYMPNREPLEPSKIIPYKITDTEVKAFFSLSNSQLFYSFIAANVATTVISFAAGLYAGFNLFFMPLLFGAWLCAIIFLLFVEINLFNGFRPLHRAALDEVKERVKQHLAANNVKAFVQCDNLSFKPYLAVFALSFLFFIAAFFSGVQLNKAEGLQNFKKLLAVHQAS